MARPAGASMALTMPTTCTPEVNRRVPRPAGRRYALPAGDRPRRPRGRYLPCGVRRVRRHVAERALHIDPVHRGPERGETEPQTVGRLHDRRPGAGLVRRHSPHGEVVAESGQHPGDIHRDDDHLWDRTSSPPA